MLTLEAAYQLALAHRGGGRLAESEGLLRQIVSVQPAHVQAWHQLGLVVLTQGRAAEAIELLGRAIALAPGEAATHSDQGVAYRHAGQFDAAIGAFQQALRLQPHFPNAHRNLADVFQAAGRQAEAIASYRTAIALAPQDAGAHNNLGNVYLQRRELPEAAACYARAVQLRPDLVPAQSNLGDVLTKLGRLAEGLAGAQRVLALDPNFADGHLNMGVAFWHMGRFAEAEACYRRAIALRPDLADAHLSLGVLLLLQGRFEEGWHEYEWHWRSPAHASRRRDFSAPPWDGRPIAGQTMLTYADQGFGDTLHFVRYLPLLLAHSQAAKVILECQAPLIPLLAQFRTPRIEIISIEDSLASPRAHAWHVPLFNLPLVLKRYGPLAMDAPYLHADEQKRATWRARLGDRDRLRVGLAWSGNPTHADDRRRSMTAETLCPILEVPGIRFVSLQIEPRGPLPPLLTNAGVLDVREYISDFTDSAALVAELDLIIAVDTSLIHLAGAQGRPAWAMLAFIPDWRWGLKSATTPWYPSLRLFRQERADDWTPVVQEIAAALRERAAR